MNHDSLHDSLTRDIVGMNPNLNPKKPRFVYSLASALLIAEQRSQITQKPSTINKLKTGNAPLLYKQNLSR